MRIVMVEPGQYARIEEIENTLSAEQEAVGGLIDCAYPWKEEACIVCNDEGLLNGMPLNRILASYGPIAGPFFVCGIRGEEFCSLTKEQAAHYQNMFLRPQFFINTEKGIVYGAYDNVKLPEAPEEALRRFKERKGLPEYCYSTLPSTGALVFLCYGERSYIKVQTQGGTEKRNTELAAELNQKMGVNQQQQAAMLRGTLFGWDAPAADPAQYENDGSPKSRKAFRKGEER